jgi:NitT/TauT family transport system substrate-binding protein
MAPKVSGPASLVLGAALCLATSALPQPARAVDDTTFGMPQDASFAYMYVAKDKGFFRDQGIDIKILWATGGVANAGLIGGTIQYSAAISTAETAIIRGAALKVIFVTERKLTHRLWSFDPAVTTLAALRGKIIAIGSRGDAEEFGTRIFLSAKNLPPDYVGYTTLPDGATRTAAIISGAQPFAVLTKLDEALLQHAGYLDKGTIIIDFEKEMDLPVGGIATSDAELEKHGDLTKRFLKATVTGMAFVQQHRPEAIAIAEKYFPNVPHESVALGVADLVEAATADGTISAGAISRELAVRGEVLGVPPDKLPPPDKVYDFSWITAVNQELKAADTATAK